MRRYYSLDITAPRNRRWKVISMVLLAEKISQLGLPRHATDYDNLDLLLADFAYRKLDRFLQRLGRPYRDLAEVLQKLGRGYTYVLLDCPPGLSILSENVFAAADLILVPTIPTVLSLRTLSRLVEHVGHRGKEAKNPGPSRWGWRCSGAQAGLYRNMRSRWLQ